MGKNRTYEEGVKCWVKGLFGAILAIPDDRVEWNATNTEVEVKGIKIDALLELKVKRKDRTPITRWQVQEALNHYFPVFLEILEDKRRVKKGRGSDVYHFKMMLWYEGKEKNLECFDLKWHEKYQECFGGKAELETTDIVSSPTPPQNPSSIDSVAANNQVTRVTKTHQMNIIISAIPSQNLNIKGRYLQTLSSPQEKLCQLKAELYRLYGTASGGSVNFPQDGIINIIDELSEIERLIGDLLKKKLQGEDEL